MKTYTKTIAVKAIKYDGTNHLAIAAAFEPLSYQYKDGVFTIFRGVDDYVVRPGDYVAEHANGRFYAHIGEAFEREFVESAGVS